MSERAEARRPFLAQNFKDAGRLTASSEKISVQAKVPAGPPRISAMVRVLDTRHRGRPGIIAATLLETSDGGALFDTGAESTFTNIVAEMQRFGCSPRDVRHVFLSHIHLDHAGAAWRFAELGATIYVHPRGAAHLKNPQRLVESATRIFGDKMTELWGTVAPVPEERLHVLEGGEKVKVGATNIRALATPGHASHHHVYVWDDNLFGGDVAGVRMGEGPVIPPFVPPELDVNAWENSLQTIREVGARNLYLPHFGLAQQAVSTHLDELAERIRRWAEWFRAQIGAGRTTEELVPAFAEYEADDLRRAGVPENQLVDYEAADPSYMAVSAAQRYWQRRRETG